MLNKKILVKGITSLSEARYCAGMFVDYISFDFTESSEYFITDKKFEEIRNWLSGVMILGTLDSNDPTEISNLIEQHQLNGFLFTENQMHLIPLINADVKILECEDLSLLPQNLDEDVILVIKDKNLNANNLPHQLTLVGYDFENVKTNISEGYAFIGSFETQVGINSYNDLMEALEYIDENY